MTYGITDDGSFRRPSETEIVESLEREQIASIDPTLDVATDPVIGPINRIIAGKLDEAWAALETIASGHDPNKATGDLLISLGKITLTKKLGATHTTVPLTCTFEKAGVLLEAGVHLANVENDLGVRFTPVENFTSPSSGNHDVLFRAEQTGPIVPITNTISIIATPVTGWTDVNNPSVATPGRDVETEDEFRERREADLDRPGSARVKAIRSDLLQVEGVQSVTFLENCTGLRDTKNGLPAHSFEMIIWAGSPSAAETSDIAAAIDASRAGGGQSHGRNSGPVLDPPNPPSIERFTLATGRDVYLVFDVVTNDEWVDVDTFETAIATELNAIHDIGDRVVSERVQALAFREGMGVEDLTAFALGFAAAPTNDENLKIGVREIARFDTTRIVVNVIS